MNCTKVTARASCASAVIRVFAWAVCAAAPATGAAQQATAALPPVVVTPARLPQALTDTLPATTVITREEIERTRNVDLVDLLSRQAGVEFARAGGVGGAASMFVRGANSGQVLVLVDGVRLNAVAGGAATLGGIALDSVERIEIARGNLSSLYGSSAIGGVVQIFTRGSREKGAAISAEIGQGRTRAATVSGGLQRESVDFGASAAVRSVEQFSAIDAARVIPGPFAAGANPDIDGNRNANGSFGLRWRGSDATQLALSGWHSRNQTDFDSTADGLTATHLEQSRLSVANAEVQHQANETWLTRLQLGAMRDHSRNRSSEPFSFDNAEFESDNRQVTWTNNVQIGGLLVAQLGFEWLQQEGASTSFDPAFGNALTGFDRDVRSAWAGIAGPIGAHQVQFNVRHDRYSDVGDATTGLLAYGYRFSPQWRGRLQVSNAFRAPSFSDLFFPFYGNPDLRAEKSRSAELGVHYDGPQTRGRLGIYRTDTSDLIVFDPATLQARNIDRARATGAELELETRFGNWRLGAQATVLRAIDRGTDLRLLRRAPHSVGANVGYDAGRWRVFADVMRVGGRDDLDINTFARTTLDAYTLARLAAAIRISPDGWLSLRVENLFDERYETVSGYNVQPRTAVVGVQWRL